jgi:hypothetical protein
MQGVKMSKVHIYWINKNMCSKEIVDIINNSVIKVLEENFYLDKNDFKKIKRNGLTAIINKILKEKGKFEREITINIKGEFKKGNQIIDSIHKFDHAKIENKIVGEIDISKDSYAQAKIPNFLTCFEEKYIHAGFFISTTKNFNLKTKEYRRNLLIERKKIPDPASDWDWDGNTTYEYLIQLLKMHGKIYKKTNMPLCIIGIDDFE